MDEINFDQGLLRTIYRLTQKHPHPQNYFTIPAIERESHLSLDAWSREFQRPAEQNKAVDSSLRRLLDVGLVQSARVITYPGKLDQARSNSFRAGYRANLDREPEILKKIA